MGRESKPAPGFMSSLQRVGIVHAIFNEEMMNVGILAARDNTSELQKRSISFGCPTRRSRPKWSLKMCYRGNTKKGG